MTELSLAEGRPSLPRGPHGLPAREVELSQRGRLLQAAVEVVAEAGWHGTTVSAIATRAGVSRRTFYEHFEDREACFRTAYARAARLHLRLVLEAGERAEGPGAVARARLDAYLRVLAGQPAFARALMVEALAAGDALRAERRRVVRRHAALLRELHEAAGRPPAPDAVYTGLAGAVDELVREHVEEGRTAELPELADPITHLHTTALEHPWT